jgi:hypothetical protein
MVRVRRIPEHPIRTLVFTLVVAVAAGWTGHNPARAANPAQWEVAAVTGKVWINHAGAGWRGLKQGATLKPGTRVETGMDGKIVLTRAGASVSAAHNSRFRIPALLDVGPPANVMQTLGTLTFSIKPGTIGTGTIKSGTIGTGGQDPFYVQTPYLTAISRGTAFTVSVADRNTTLHVTSGAVRAVSMVSAESSLVRSGETAAVDLRSGGRITLSGAGRWTPGRGTENAAPGAVPATPAVKLRATDAAAPGRAAYARRIADLLFDSVADKLAGFERSPARGNEPDANGN